MSFPRIGFTSLIAILSLVYSIEVPAAPKRYAVSIKEQARRVVAELKARPIRPKPLHAESGGESIDVGLKVKKGDWLQVLYSKNLVEASWATRMLSDRRVLFEVLSIELGKDVRDFYPKTIGLKEFLVQRGLADKKGKLIADGDKIEAALYKEFTAGFTVRPAVGVDPKETGRGIYQDTDAFMLDLLTSDSRIVSEGLNREAIRSQLLGEVASGEAFILQEDFINLADIRKPLKTKFYQRVRIHTYENNVIAGAIPERWVQSDFLSEDQIKAAEVFVRKFLSRISKGLLSRQAWGVDVAVLDNGEMRIVDIITNRGKPIAWSSYLEQPHVIAAYTRHLEKETGLRFGGVSGFLIRSGFANYFPYWEKRIEMAKPGLSKLLAYLPPNPIKKRRDD